MKLITRFLPIGAAALGVLSLSAATPAQAAGNRQKPVVNPAVHHDVSLPLRDIPSQARDLVVREHDRPKAFLTHHVDAPEAALQTSVGPAISTTGFRSFAGVGNGDYGFAPNSAPPDTNGAVGATQYVQWVNESFAVFDKTTGAIVAGPLAGNTLWAGFGGGCQSNNDGDPIVQYDKLANRWILTQFSVTTTPYLQCVAVSSTSDATGSYNRYSFPYGNNFNDYGKMGVWPDGYYMAYNMFANGQSFIGGQVCAFDRAKMLTGAAATQVCFQLSTSFGGLLPSDLDGTTAPPAGSPNYVMNFGTNSLNLWKFHVDYVTPGNSTLAGPTNIPVAGFTKACGGGTCVPQAGTNQKLDSLADRLMYRLAYRNFGTHESLVVNHSVKVGTSRKNPFTGVRWYEIRNPGGTPTVFQQATFAPDTNYRWMGSIAMDKVGNMAMGYSASSSSINPGIAFTGRAAGDPLNTMGTESSMLAGTGSQLGSNLSRWGDYSSITVDPLDDCTFWYTTEYLKSNGAFNWSTEIGSFKMPSCF